MHTQYFFSPQMQILARDEPGSGAVSKTAVSNVVITVLRNPNAPVMTENYETMISEYLPVQGYVISVQATDDDPDGVSVDL